VLETIEEQRIAVADAATGEVRQVSPANLYVYDYDWSPDGKTFAAEAAEGSGTNNYWIAQLYTVDAQSGRTKSIWKPPLQIACPRWSPDGAEIAVIHGIMSDEGLTGGDIWTVPAGGGAPKNRTDGMKASASSLFWRSRDEILFTEYVDGDEAIATLDAAGKIRTLWRGSAVVTKFTVAKKSSASATVFSKFSQPPEVVAGPIGSWIAMTRVNAGIHPLWGEARSLTWESDGHRVQGWLLPPLDPDPARKSPMVVSVHGGPSAAATAGWTSRWPAVLASQGYYVFLPNPRGSYGQGEAFTQGNVKDFGHGDLRDIDRGIDAALAAAPIDPKKLGICGWSYGGYMAMWAVTQTNRYAAAVAGAGIVSWQSYYGQNRIDQWLLPFFGASVYDDPDVYARSSPITYIKKVKTPTLVLHGDRDSEVPTPQGYEFWHALKTLGVPTALVIYENEGHSITDPKHQLDRDRRLVEWFDRYLR
jgi:dipeptidyl aminopeptidase/acylaminoacyl peptidase